MLNWPSPCRPLLFAVAFALQPAFAAETPVWSPPEEDLPKLAETVTEEFFTVRPPAEYERQENKGPNGSKLVAWVSPPRADDSRGYLMAVQQPLPPEELNRYRLEIQLDKMLAGIAARRDNWKQSRPQRGTLNGQVFVRAYWEGTEKSTRKPMTGFYYLTHYKEGLLGFSGQDFIENSKTDLRLAESAALTAKLTP